MILLAPNPGGQLFDHAMLGFALHAGLARKFRNSADS